MKHTLLKHNISHVYVNVPNRQISVIKYNYLVIISIVYKSCVSDYELCTYIITPRAYTKGKVISFVCQSSVVVVSMKIVTLEDCI